MIKFTGFMKSAAVIAPLWLVLIVPGCAQSLGETEKELLRIQDEWAGRGSSGTFRIWNVCTQGNSACTP